MEAEILAVLTGLVAVTGVIVAVLLIVWFRERSRRLRDQMIYAERKLAIEKGLPVPPLPEVPVRKANYVMRGLVWIAVGFGLIFISIDETDFPERNDYQFQNDRIVSFWN